MWRAVKSRRQKGRNPTSQFFVGRGNSNVSDVDKIVIVSRTLCNTRSLVLHAYGLSFLVTFLFWTFPLCSYHS